MIKILSLTVLVVVLAMTNTLPIEGELKVRGGVRTLTADELTEAKEALTLSLDKLYGSEEGPHYKLAQVNSATKQLVAGTLYKINADLIDSKENTKTCDVKIWSQPWLQDDNAIEITFECKGEEIVVKKHSV